MSGISRVQIDVEIGKVGEVGEVEEVGEVGEVGEIGEVRSQMADLYLLILPFHPLLIRLGVS